MYSEIKAENLEKEIKGLYCNRHSRELAKSRQPSTVYSTSWKACGPTDDKAGRNIGLADENEHLSIGMSIFENFFSL